MFIKSNFLATLIIFSKGIICVANYELTLHKFAANPTKWSVTYMFNWLKIIFVRLNCSISCAPLEVAERFLSSQTQSSLISCFVSDSSIFSSASTV